MTDATEEEEAEEDSGQTPIDYIFLDVMEGGSSTVILDEKAVKDRGIVALHVCGGSVYALLLSDMKLHKLDEVKGFPAPASVRAIRATKPE
jgi:hypothetical protein